MRHWINLLVEFITLPPEDEKTPEKGLTIHVNGEADLNNPKSVMFIAKLDGKEIGWFCVDFTHAKKGRVSVHSNMEKEHTNQGYGPKIYDWIEQYLEKKGIKFGPSDRLTDNAYRMWRKRCPEAIAEYRMYDDRRGDWCSKLWYSPEGWEKWVVPELARARASAPTNRHDYL